MAKQVKKENKDVKKQSPQQPKWVGIGLATYIVSIIFCVLESIGALIAILIIVLTSVSSQSGGQPPEEGSGFSIVFAAVGGVFALVVLIFGIIATIEICKKTKAGAHLNLALSICSIIFFNIVVGILATVYSTQVPVKKITA